MINKLKIWVSSLSYNFNNSWQIQHRFNNSMRMQNIQTHFNQEMQAYTLFCIEYKYCWHSIHHSFSHKINKRHSKEKILYRILNRLLGHQGGIKSNFHSMHIHNISLISKSILMGNPGMFCSCCKISLGCRQFRLSKIRFYMTNKMLDRWSSRSCKAWYNFGNRCFSMHWERTLVGTQDKLLRSILSRSKDICGRRLSHWSKPVQTQFCTWDTFELALLHIIRSAKDIRRMSHRQRLSIRRNRSYISLSCSKHRSSLNIWDKSSSSLARFLYSWNTRWSMFGIGYQTFRYKFHSLSDIWSIFAGPYRDKNLYNTINSSIDSYSSIAYNFLYI